MRARLMTLAMSLAWLAGPSAARAESGEEILKKVDEAEYGARDKVAVVAMELEDKDGTKSVRKLKMYQKGTDKRMIKFLEPAEVKGMAFLDAGDEKMYLYLPAMHKIRRIAGHVKNDNFAGTDFSFDDLSSEPFTNRLEVRQAEDQGDHYTLKLVPKTGEESQYGWLTMKVRKKDYKFAQLDFYDKAGVKWKVMNRDDFRAKGKYVQSYFTQLSDLKKQHSTRNRIESVEFDTGLKDRFFSKRQLKRR